MIKHILKLIWNKKSSNALLILEIFLSFLVLFATMGYMVFNWNNLSKPLGYDTEDRWMVSIDNEVTLQDSAELVTTLHSLKTELEANEHVEDVTFLESISYFSYNNWRNSLTTEGQVSVNTNVMPVDLDNADLMNVTVKEGRWFNEDDLLSPYSEIIVNQLFVDESFPGQSIIDTLFTSGGETYKVVGVVDQLRYLGPFDEPYPTMYMLKHFYECENNIILKMRPNTPASVEEEIITLVNSVSKNDGNLLESLEKRKTEKSRHSKILLIAMLIICGFLCVNVALGLFGVLWYNINKRRGEIGLRQAVGAHGFDITKQFITEITMLTAFGVGLGVFFAIQVPLLNITEYDDSIFYKAIIYATLIIFALVLACALYPSLQAAKIKPAIALHEE